MNEATETKSNVGIIVAGKNTSNEMSDFKRPSHPDFMNHKELVDSDFSGLRNNSIAHTMEVWLCGVMQGSMTLEMIARYPEQWEDLYRDIFALKNVEQLPMPGEKERLI